MFALVGTALIAAVVAGVMIALGVARDFVLAGATDFVVMSLLWLPATRRWNARGHLCWTASVYLFVVYLIFILHWTFASHLGVASTIGLAAQHASLPPDLRQRRARNGAVTA